MPIKKISFRKIITTCTSVAGRMVLATDNGIFEFDDAINDFVPLTFFKKYSAIAPIRLFKRRQNRQHLVLQ